MTNTITNTEDLIDVRDVIARYEELEGDFNREALESKQDDYTEEEAEFVMLYDLLDELRDKSGDEQWRGDWYPVSLIRYSYFTESIEELTKDCGYISNDLPWWIEIDWQATADHCKIDYSTVEIDGIEYYYR